MGTFAMGIVHEVSTPLAVILGRAEQLLGRANQDERSVHAAQAIVQQVDRIQVVIRRFLDMARGGPPALARTDPGDVVRSAAASVEHRFANAGISLAANIPPDMPEVHCDRGLLEQAIVNLLLNACDACPEGGRSRSRRGPTREQVAFVVTDDGQGIAPIDADRAKKAFFTTKPPGAGSGLGLAIASEIAKSHRGEFTIAPKEPRGTRACIEIPL
jgi:signal transduction histidine kinase